MWLQAENCALLGHYAASSGNLLPTFRHNLSVSSSTERYQISVLGSVIGQLHDPAVLNIFMEETTHICPCVKEKEEGMWRREVQVHPFWSFRIGRKLFYSSLYANISISYIILPITDFLINSSFLIISRYLGLWLFFTLYLYLFFCIQWPK
jgi:hypothetical protein